MHSYLSNSNILCKKDLLNFLRSFFPFIYFDLRCEQFMNIKIIKSLKSFIKAICEVARYRKSYIIQSKDIRIVFLQGENIFFPNVNFLGKNKIHKKKSS